jgi:hypothetical protein
MLSIEVRPYASDALEDAMRLAQTKALNSYSWSDCLNYLNYTWMDIYQRLAQMDEGYYSITTQLTRRLTKLPAFVKNSIRIYSAQSPFGHSREMFRASGYNDLESTGTYHISGFDLYCPDAERRTVWLNYIPMQPMLFFTRNNRDPKIYNTYTPPAPNNNYNMYTLFEENGRLIFKYKNTAVPHYDSYSHDVTDTINTDPDTWELVYINCDFPYVFVTHKNRFTEEYRSGFYKNIIESSEYIAYNPFAFSGRSSNVEYLHTTWNDKTGLGVIIKDHNDNGIIKELGWTPDTVLIYPAPEMYRLLVARLADKFSALNESNVMGVQKELIEATYAFDNFIKKDKSAWQRIDNVNGPTVTDLL